MINNTEGTKSIRRRVWLTLIVGVVLFLLVLAVGFFQYIRNPEPRNRVLDKASLEELKVGQHFDEVVRILKIEPGDYSVSTRSPFGNPPLFHLGISNSEHVIRKVEWNDDLIHLWIAFDKQSQLVGAFALPRSTGTMREYIRYQWLGYVPGQ